MLSPLQELRYAFRSLIKEPTFTALALVSLGLGTGAATTMFSVVQHVLLDPLPYQDPSRVVTFQIRDAMSGSTSRRAFEAQEFLEYQANTSVFDEVIGTAFQDILHTTREGTEQFRGCLVTGNAFAFLGVQPALGRVLAPSDLQTGAPPVFVMSHKLWVKHFGGDRNILGKAYVLNDVATTLIGVMPPRFTKLNADLWTPVRLDGDDTSLVRRYFFFEGRLRRGVTVAQAQSEISLVAQRVGGLYPKNYPEKFEVKVMTVVDAAVGRFRTTLYTLAAAVTLLLLIACANVCSMLLTRATTREAEMAVMASLGASRPGLFRRLLSESIALAFLASVAGCVCAYFGIKLLVGAIPEGIVPTEAAVRINMPVLLFSLCLVGITTIACGLVPAFLVATKKDLVGPLKNTGHGTCGGFLHSRLHQSLVLAEVALSVWLLATGGLLMRSLIKLQTVELGFNPSNVIHARLPLPRPKYGATGTLRAFFDELLSRLEKSPGVIAAAATSGMPPHGGVIGEVVVGRDHQGRGQSLFQFCSEGYFRTIGLQFVRGRALQNEDFGAASRVVVVNQTFAAHYFGTEDPIGQSIELTMLAGLRDTPVESPVFEVIGVVRDVKNQGIRDAALPEVFVPYTVTSAFPRGILVRTTGHSGFTLDNLQRDVWASDRSVALTLTGSLDDYLKSISYAEPRFAVVVVGVFSGIGLALTVLGVFSVTSYSVAQRTREIGLRMALGANPANVVSLVVIRQGFAPLFLGVCLGVTASLGTSSILASQLFGIGSRDPATYLAVISLVLGVGLLSGFLSARRAILIDPLTALRS